MRKSLFIILLSVFLSASVCFGINIAYASNNGNKSFVFATELAETYRMGQTIDIPSATIGDVQADFIVYLPDGTSTNSSSISLSVCGNYSIEYFAKENGKTYIKLNLQIRFI